jgi:mono/diheme cytochrome c family protein
MGLHGNGSAWRAWLLASVFLLVGGAAHAAETYEEVSAQILKVSCVGCHSGLSAPAGLDLSSYASLMASGVIVPGKPEESYLFERIEAGEMPPKVPLTAAEVDLVRRWILAGAPDAPPAPPQQISIREVLPRTGPTTGKTDVMIFGENLQNVTQVTFDKELCTNLKIVDPMTLSCTTPAAKQSGFVTVTASDGVKSADFLNGFEYRIPLAPTYESLLVNVFEPRCIGCHSGPNARKGLDLSTYQSTLRYPRAVDTSRPRRSRLYKKTASGEMPMSMAKAAAQPLSRAEVDTILQWIVNGAPEKESTMP